MGSKLYGLETLRAYAIVSVLLFLRLLLKEPLGVNTVALRLKISEYHVSKHL